MWHTNFMKTKSDMNSTRQQNVSAGILCQDVYIRFYCKDGDSAEQIGWSSISHKWSWVWLPEQQIEILKPFPWCIVLQNDVSLIEDGFHEEVYLVFSAFKVGCIQQNTFHMNDWTLKHLPSLLFSYLHIPVSLLMQEINSNVPGYPSYIQKKVLLLKSGRRLIVQF